MNNLTIQSKWERFSRDRFATNTEVTEETKKAVEVVFYAGAIAVLTLIWDMSELSGEAAMGVMEGLHAEADQYVNNLFNRGNQ